MAPPLNVRTLLAEAHSALAQREADLRQCDQQAARVAALRLDEQQCREAGEALAALAVQRRGRIAALLSQSATAAVQQVWGEEMQVSVGDPNGQGSRAEARVVVSSDGVFEDLDDSRGDSVRAVVNFALWVELMHLRAKTDGLRPFTAFDEPFLALRPELFPLVQRMFEACADNGIQLLVVTNQEAMIPDSALHAKLPGRGDA